ncbi:MAG: winged helix-turn-helix transcriptional regulator [Candidatus Nanohalobium sp.]
MADQEMPEWCETEEWCPITVTAELLGRKWHPVIIHRLLQEDLGFKEMQRQVHKISDKVLSESLKDLQEKGIVEKEIVEESPKEVKYCLTEKGESLEEVVTTMKDWGEENYGK